MNFHCYILLFVAAIGLATCQKNNLPVVDPHLTPVDTTTIVPVDTTNTLALGEVFVLKNGAEWNVPFKAVKFHSDSAFVLYGYYLYPNKVSQSFVINDIPCKTGVYPIEYWPTPNNLKPNHIPHTGFAMMFEGDQPVGFFYLDTLQTDHFVEVTSFDSITRIVEGRFQVSLKIDTPSSFPNTPTEIALTEGRFHLKIQ
jgi:hypothetical protein